MKSSFLPNPLQFSFSFLLSLLFVSHQSRCQLLIYFVFMQKNKNYLKAMMDGHVKHREKLKGLKLGVSCCVNLFYKFSNLISCFLVIFHYKMLYKYIPRSTGRSGGQNLQKKDDNFVKESQESEISEDDSPIKSFKPINQSNHFDFDNQFKHSLPPNTKSKRSKNRLRRKHR